MSFYSNFAHTKKLFMYLETNDSIFCIEIVLLYPLFHGKTDKLYIFVTS